jgi:hypothetical protein
MINPFCAYELSTTLEKGLTTHKKKMHDKPKLTEECSSFPKQCEKKLKTHYKMKVHTKTHSYIKAEYKCDKYWSKP